MRRSALQACTRALLSGTQYAPSVQRTVLMQCVPAALRRVGNAGESLGVSSSRRLWSSKAPGRTGAQPERAPPSPQQPVPSSVEEEIFGDSPSAEEVARWDAEADAWARQLGYSARTFDAEDDDAVDDERNVTVLAAPPLPAEYDDEDGSVGEGGDWNDDVDDTKSVVTSRKASATRGAPTVRLGTGAAAATKAVSGNRGPSTAAQLFGDEPFTTADAASAPSSGAALRRGRRGAFEPRWRLPESMIPRVAIVGRPNVGKSALFNRITGTNDAIVHDVPGVTRDRRYTRASWQAREMMLIDTGGLMTLPGEDVGATRLTRQERAALAGGAAELPGMIEQQAAAAVAEADALIVVVDGQTGLTTADADIITWLRRRYGSKPFILAVNKCESPVKGEAQASAFWELGVEPIAVSAISSTGVGDLLDRLVDVLPEEPSNEDGLRDTVDGTAEVGTPGMPLRVAIVGRPNVGKSSLLNCLCGSIRSVVSDAAGTTTDAVDVDVTDAQGRSFRLIDTAGIRRRAKVAKAEDGTEELSVERSLRALRRAHVAALVLDAPVGATEQDWRIATKAVAEGCALVLVINKWDTMPNKESNTQSKYEQALRLALRDFPWAPVVFTTAITGQRVGAILRAAAGVSAEHGRRLPTATLNAVIRDAMAWKSPPVKGGKVGRLYYATQAGVRPPTFVLFVNDADLFIDSYRRYIERALRDNVGYKGTPIRLLFRGKDKGGGTQGGAGGAAVPAR